MAKLTNTSKGDFGLPCGVIVQAGQTVEVEDEVLDNDLNNVVVKGWLKMGSDPKGTGGLVLGDYVAPDDEEDAVDDGLDKLSKQELIEEADKDDLDFDEKKVTKAQLITLIRDHRATAKPE